MQTRRFGPIPDPVPVLGLGTWNLERAPRGDAVGAIRRAIERGMTHIDTAEMYGSGEVETITGEAIAGLRDRVFLVSKVLPNNASKTGTARACEASLKRLGTDHLDLYLLHWPGHHPLAETVSAFERLKTAGKIRAWGVSNFDDGDLADAAALVPRGTIACNQVLYHLGERTIEHRVIPWCEQHGIAVVAYSPLGNGAFPDASSPGGKVLGEVAARLGATPRQVALAFLTRRPSTFAIPKSASSAHVDELAGEVALDDAAIAAIDAAFPVAPWRGLPTL